MVQTRTTSKQIDLDLSVEELAEVLNADATDVLRNETILDAVEHASLAIKEAREERGWDRKRLASVLQVTEARVCQLESGTLRNAPSLKTLATIAFHLGMELRLEFVEASSGDSVGHHDRMVKTAKAAY